MSIKKSLDYYKSDLFKVNAEIENVKGTSAIDLIHDANIRVSNVNLKFKDDLEELTLVELNNKLKANETILSSLNDLWILRNLFHEIETSLNPIDAVEYLCDKFELQSIVSNLQKLDNKFTQMKGILVVDSTREHFDDLLTKVSEQLNVCFQRMFPDNYTNCIPIQANGIEMDYDELAQVIEGFEKLGNHLESRSRIPAIYLKWDTLILDELILRNKKLRLEIDSTKQIAYTLKIEDSTDDVYDCFRSIIDFMKFVNRTKNAYFKNFFLSKISNYLTGKISKNVAILNNSKEGNNNLILSLTQLANDTDWNLLIARTLNSEQDINKKLDQVYQDWLVDEKLDEIRKFFNTSFVALICKTNKIEYSRAERADIMRPENKDENNSQEKDEDDAWNTWDNESWDQHSTEQPLKEEKLEENTKWSDDGWDDDEWDLDELENKKKIDITNKKDGEDSNHYIISEVPEKLMRILDGFKKEATEVSIEPLISMIMALSLISYPSMQDSFLLLNDLAYLNQEGIENKSLNEFLRHNEQQMKREILKQVLRKFRMINLNSYRSDIPSSADSSLDIETQRKIEDLSEVFAGFERSQLRNTNPFNYENLIVDIINLLSEEICKEVFSLEEILENHSTYVSAVIKGLETIFDRILKQVNPSANLSSFKKLDNIVFLLNSHLNEIMDSFYQGEFFNLSTDELISIIKAVFAESGTRDSYIKEILDIRSLDNT